MSVFTKLFLDLKILWFKPDKNFLPISSEEYFTQYLTISQFQIATIEHNRIRENESRVIVY